MHLTFQIWALLAVVAATLVILALAAINAFGRVAQRHLAYAGNQFELSAIRLDSGPAGAKLLRDDGVDVVLLTPV